MAKFAGVTARSDPAVGDPAVVYRLRIMVAGISPLIWRRLLAPGQTTLAELHAVVQTVFGWGGEHLHRFVIHGTEYGISYVGGQGFRHDARDVRLGELGLRLGPASPEKSRSPNGPQTRPMGAGRTAVSAPFATFQT